MGSEQRVAIYGGSFDPPHMGHAMVAAWVLWSGLADALWLVPTYQHAFDKSLAPFEIRCELASALAGLLGRSAQLCAIEAELPAPSYTASTLDALAARHPELRFRLVVGSDVLEAVDKWRRWEHILRCYPPIVVARRGHPNPQHTPEMPDISSTEVRRRIAEGESVQELVPAAVRELLPRWSQARREPV